MEKISYHPFAPKKDTVYVIRRNATMAGICSYAITSLEEINYALKQGYVPYIFMSDKNPYLDDEDVGRINAWEFFFKNKYSINVKDLRQYRKVIISDGTPKLTTLSDSMTFFENHSGIRNEWSILANEWLLLSEELKTYFQKKKEEYFSDQDRVLGILCRGTDYTVVKPKNHPVQPMPEEILEKAQKVISDYNINKVFVATESPDTLAFFKNHLDIPVITFQSDYVEYHGKLLADDIEKMGNKKAVGIQYMANVLMLSQCNCFIAGRTSGTVVAALLQTNYEYEYYWDLGVY